MLISLLSNQNDDSGDFIEVPQRIGLAVALEETAARGAIDQLDSLAVTLEDPAALQVMQTVAESLVVAVGDQSEQAVVVLAADAFTIGLSEPVEVFRSPLILAEVCAAGLMERAEAGTTEPWPVGDTLADVNGVYTWTRIGTAWHVADQAAALGDTGTDVALAYNQQTLGTADQDVSATVNALDLGDAPRVQGAVIARKADNATLTYYEWRAVAWAGGNRYELRRVVAGVETAIGVVEQLPQGNDRLRLWVAAVPPVLTGFINESQVIGPLIDVGGIETGDFAGIAGMRQGGTEGLVRIRLDDWLGRPAPPEASVIPVRAVDTVRSLLVESRSIEGALLMPESLGIGLTERRQPGIELPIERIDLAVGVLDAAALVERAAGLGDAVAVDLGEQAAVTVPWLALSEADTLSVEADEVTIFLEPIPQIATTALVIGLLERGDRTIPVPALIEFIRSQGEVVGVAGPSNEGAVIAGPTDETVQTEAG